MIISHLWLTRRLRNDDPVESFLTLVTNLETAALRFRFRFVATEEHHAASASGKSVDALKASVHLIFDGGVNDPLRSLDAWALKGRNYQLTADFEIRPGETLTTGLEMTSPTPSAHFSKSAVFLPGGFLRGHWELTLPALPRSLSGPPTQLTKPQRDQSARVLVTAIRRMYKASDPPRLIQDQTWPLPLASGKAEHLIPPETGDMVDVTSGPPLGASPGRAAPKRAAKRRR